MKRFSVLASGNGGNLQAIIGAVKARRIKGDLALVFSDKADAYALTRARKAKISTVHLNPKDFADRAAFDHAVLKVLKEHQIDVIVLAGYMRLLSPGFINAYANKIINIHPSLLPAFKGTRGIQDAFEYGVKVTGVTVHYVINEVDAGAIIAQETVVISPRDTLKTLEAKIHKLEHKLYPKVIGTFLKQG